MELALAGPAAPYSPPALGAALTADDRKDVVWWAVVVGFSYALALAWATWCKLTGGDPDISFGWSGFKVSCKSKT
jgi:hypothetical protein